LEAKIGKETKNRSNVSLLINNGSLSPQRTSTCLRRESFSRGQACSTDVGSDDDDSDNDDPTDEFSDKDW
jgi:hypothetical protein